MKLELSEDSFKINGFINQENEIGVVITLNTDDVYALWCALNTHNQKCVEKLADKNLTLSQYCCCTRTVKSSATKCF